MKTETDLLFIVPPSSSAVHPNLSVPLFPKAKKCAKVGWKVFPRKASCPTRPTPELPWSCSTPTPRPGWCCTAGLTAIHPWHPWQRCRSVARPWPVPARGWCKRRCTVLYTTCGSVAMMRFWTGKHILLFFNVFFIWVYDCMKRTPEFQSLTPILGSIFENILHLCRRLKMNTS